MDNTIVINDCGKIKRIYRSKLYELLFKADIKIRGNNYNQWLYFFRAHEIITDFNAIFLYLHETLGIQIYQDGCIRLFLKYDYYLEEPKSIFIRNATKGLLEVLQSI